MTRLNPWQYADAIVRIVDVYGRRCWVDKAGLDNPKQILIPLCRKDGMRRSNTKAGDDGLNLLHRDNIAHVLQTKNTGVSAQ